MTLARIMYRDNPALFKDLEGARDSIRYARGARGSKAAVHATRRREIVDPHDPFAELPEGMSQLSDWTPHLMCPKGGKVLVISDLHIPYHSSAAIKGCLNFALEYKPTHILINGDLQDNHKVSHWERDPRGHDYATELNAGRLFLEVLRDKFPEAVIVFKLGNHDEWLERYLSVKAPELLGVADFQLDRLLRCADVNVDVVRDKRPVMAGKLAILHGHEFSKGIAAPVNPARGFYMKAKESCLGGHFHQVSEHTEKTAVSDKLITTWSTGCLCDMRPRYAPFNNWSHGWATVDVEKNGEFQVRNYRMYRGKLR